MKPNTIAKSIAIGNPADGFQVLRSVRSTGGSGAMVSDDEIIDGIQLLAETEGIFTEPAGGVTVAATRKLIERGAIPTRRVDRHLHHRQRLQDRRSDERPRRRADPDRPVAGGVRKDRAGFGAGGCRGVIREALLLGLANGLIRGAAS